MTVVVVAHRMRPERLLARVAAHLAPGATMATTATDWGAVIVVDAPSWEAGRWLVAGLPQADPWGLPGMDLAGDRVALELERYGPAAIQLTSGPLVAVDMSTGAVLRAFNGIMPLAVSSTGGWAASTSPDVLTCITGARGLSVEAGSLASPGGTFSKVCGGMVAESLPGVTWSGIDAEIERRLAPLGRLGEARLARGPALEEDGEIRYVRCRPDWQRAVFVPPLSRELTRGAEMTYYTWLREHVLPQLWWRARLVGLWLCAPAFERPAFDLVMSAAGSHDSRGGVA